jgi:predicted DNA-binding WGR domain protein
MDMTASNFSREVRDNMKKYLEFNDEKSSKFWEIEVSGFSHTVRYGKIGTDGISKTKVFGTEDEALMDAEKLMKSKMKKGYVETSTDNIILTYSQRFSRKFIKLHEKINKALEDEEFEKIFNDGATVKEISEFKKGIKVNLTESFYELYEIHNGSSNFFTYDGLYLKSLSDILSTKKVLDESESLESSPDFQESEWWDAAWIPFLDDYSSKIVAIDTKGSFDGKAGQIIEWEKESRDRPIIHESFDSWLQTQVYIVENLIQYDGEEYEELIEELDLDEDVFEKLNPGYPIYNTTLGS